MKAEDRRKEYKEERMKRLKFSQKWQPKKFQELYSGGRLRLSEEEKKVLKKQGNFKP